MPFWKRKQTNSEERAAIRQMNYVREIISDSVHKALNSSFRDINEKFNLDEDFSNFAATESTKCTDRVSEVFRKPIVKKIEEEFIEYMQKKTLDKLKE